MVGFNLIVFAVGFGFMVCARFDLGFSRSGCNLERGGLKFI